MLLLFKLVIIVCVLINCSESDDLTESTFIATDINTENENDYASTLYENIINSTLWDKNNNLNTDTTVSSSQIDTTHTSIITSTELSTSVTLDDIESDFSYNEIQSNEKYSNFVDSSTEEGSVFSSTSSFESGELYLNSKESAENNETPWTNKTCTKCQNPNPIIKNFAYDEKSHVITWDPIVETLDECKYEYKINRTSQSIIPYFRVEANNSHKLDNLKMCEKYDLVIQTHNICGYNDTLNTSFYTEAVPVYGLKLQFNGKTQITWDNAFGSYCSRYRIHINDDTFDTNINYFEADGNLYCVKIGVQTVRDDNKSGEISTKQVPGLVQNLKIEEMETALTVSWEPPENSECVSGYKIKFNEQFFETENVEYTFESLDSCTNFIIEVAATSITRDDGEYSQISGTTKTPERVKMVQNPKFQYEEGNNLLLATWNPPELQKNCITNYVLVVWSADGSITLTDNTIETQYKYEKIIGCMEYNLIIKAQITAANEMPTDPLLEIIPAKLSEPPTYSKYVIGQTSANITFKMHPKTENKCFLKSLIVECNALPEENEGEWIIKEVVQEKDINDDRKDVTIELLEKLSPYTNYTCIGKLTNDAGTSDPSLEFKMQTKEDVPSKPQDFKSENVDERSYDLTWKKPAIIPGELTEYEISVEQVKPLHYIPNGCTTNELSSKKNVNSDIFDLNCEALPHFEYNCKIRAKTYDFGEETAITVQTLISKPEEPRDFNATIEINNAIGEEYKVSFIMSWLYPCHSNGNVKHFTLKMIETQELVKTEQDFIVEVNDNLEIIDYAYNIDNIKPEMKYIFQLQTVVDNLKSDYAELTLLSPDGYPGPPIIKIVTVESDNSISIEWDEPAEKNGKIEEYKIFITKEALHDIPDDEDCKYDDDKIEIPVDGTKTNYLFTNTLANHKYYIIIKAKTSLDYGEPSNEIDVVTQESDSESVRDISAIIKNSQDSDEYIANVSISFKKPCNTNSVLKYYSLKLSGYRHENNITVENVNITDETQEIIYNLFPDYNYTVSVEVFTDFGSGAINSTEFTSPAGVPTSTSETTTIKDVSTKTVIVAFTTNMFDDSNGNIKYYAIIIKSTESYNNSQYGYWNGADWPDTGKWSIDGIDDYQTTEMFWNPFSDSEETTIFTIGEENCTNANSNYCNGPLKPNTKYSVVIRAFTKNGFRDSEEVNFVTENLEKALNTLEIIGICVGILAILLICGIIGYLWWRKRRATVFEKIIQDEVKSTLVPIKEFPQYYQNLSENFHILKQDFTTLNTISAEAALPTTIAAAQENRKKNRYTNILPYDDTRVILQNDSNDYINASYINGYSEKVEYIATQGPLECTTTDFWNMVINENVSIIVMVAQFVEQRKEKCYKYIPNKQEQIELDDGIQIRCAVELDFDYYCERQIILQKDDKQHKITHLQFLNWPDFGCPKGTENMLNFCLFLREQIDAAYGKVVVHCSAGVGRTGTLIAIDILLQTIKDGGDIDVYNTVANLRKQRKNMVQTESQYMYIHNCINDAILDPPELKEIKATEPIYENIKDNIELKVIKSDDNENIESEG